MFEGRRAVAVVGIAHTGKGTSQGDGGHIKRTAIGGGPALIHILDALRTVVGTRGVEIDLQIAYRFEHRLYLQVFVVVDGSRRGHTVVHQQPVVVHRLVDITITHYTEGEVETRCHDTTRTLAEHIPNIRQEAGQMHGVLRTETDIDTAHHHQHTGYTLGWLIPPLFLDRGLGGDAELQLYGVAVLDEDLIGINHLVLQIVGFTVLGTGRDDEPFGAFIMGYGDGAVEPEGDLPLVGVLVLGQNLLIGILGFRLVFRLRLTSGGCLAEAFVNLLEEGRVVIERL